MADRRRILMAQILMITFFITASNGASNCCSDCIQCPGHRGSCILRSQLCNSVNDCQYEEDENEAFCKIYNDSSCPRGHTYCSSGDCVTWNTACSPTIRHDNRRYNSYSSLDEIDCSEKLYSEVCLAFAEGRLPSTLSPPEASKTKVDMDQVSLYLLAGNCSQTDTQNSTKCPMLYTDVAGTCLAPLPFELSWPAAHQVCHSIAGKLVEFEDVTFFSEIVQHLINTDLASDFWIGGFFDLEENAWAWSSGGKMPSSTPYWTLKYNSTCQTRQSSSGVGPVPGCFHYQQAPLTFTAGHCAALRYRYLYYMSDEPCFENKRPLCIPTIQ